MQKLINTCVEMAIVGTPCAWMSENGLEVSGHWSATKIAIEDYLKRDLSNLELTCLSLSRGYGPAPEISDNEFVEIVSYQWPQGNNRGEWLDWSGLQELLEDWQDILHERDLLEDQKKYLDEISRKEGNMKTLFSRIGKSFPENIYWEPGEGWNEKTNIRNGSWTPVKYKFRWTSCDYRRAQAMGIAL